MDTKRRKEDVMAAARKIRRTDKKSMNKNKQGWGRRRGSTHGSWTGASRRQRTQSGTSGKEAGDWNIWGRYVLECSGQHQGEEAAAARRKGARCGGERPQGPGRGCGRGKGWWKGGRAEGKRQDAEGETQETEQGEGEKEKGEAAGKEVS